MSSSGSRTRACAQRILPETMMLEKILVWDLPVRIGHWLLAAAFAVAWLTGESENWRAVHVAAGALMCAVVVFRLLWGFIGSRHARFADFAAGPLAAFAYLGDLLRRRAAHFTGHNPAGAWAIYLLLSLSLAAAASGWCVYSGLGGEAAEELHELTANALLLLVGLHIVGVVVGGLLHDENLVRAMLTGRKLGRREDAITRSHLPAALVLLVWAAAVAWLSRYI